MKGLHKRTSAPSKDVMSWMKEDDVAQERKKDIRATTKIVLHLIDYMDKHQMSQTDLAHKLDVTPQYINKLLHGQDYSFRIDTAIEYGEKLGIKLVDVPTSEDDMDLSFGIGNLCLRLAQVGQHPENYAISSAISGILRSNKAQKWHQSNQNQLVTA